MQHDRHVRRERNKNRAQGIGRRWLPLVAGLALLATAGAHEGDGSGAFEVIMPPGECRLTLFPDGSANIHYGAAPWVVRVAPQTFDYSQQLYRFEQLALQRREPGVTPDVSLMLPGTSLETRLQDAAHVRQLLERAWQARLPSSNEFEQGYPDLIRQACRFD